MKRIEVFLSHWNGDRAFALQLEETLESHGISVWLDLTCMRPSMHWLDEIEAALDRCDWFVILYSQKTVASAWVKRELAAAFSEERLEGKIVPVVIEQSGRNLLPWPLRGVQSVDFASKPYDDACRDLLRVWDINE